MSKVVLSHPLHEEMMAYLEENVDEIAVVNGGSPSELLAFMEKDADAVIIRIGQLDRATIEKCPALKVIGRPGVGYDNVDIKAATENSIPVVYTPGANARAVAEHAVSFMFSVAKNGIFMDSETKKGNYSSRLSRLSIELFNKKILVIGFGAIGRIVSELSAAIGMNVYIYDPVVEEKAVKDAGYNYVKDLNSFLPELDVLTLHCPLNDKTNGIIGEKELSLLKSDAIVINCARGGLVDEKALVAAVTEGRIFGAGFDVFENEPVSVGEEILSSHNIIVSPHTAGMTKESLITSQKECIDGVLAVLNGEKWQRTVNPEVFS